MAEAAYWSDAEGRLFEFSGDWFSKGAGGQVLRWDRDRGQWEVPFAHELPFFMHRPRFTSLKVPANWVYVSLALFIVACAGAIFADLDRINLALRIDRGQFVSSATANNSDDVYEGMKAFQGILFYVTAGFFIWWTRRATCNARSLGVPDPDFSPGWAVGWWFIPFANLVQPFRVVAQAWRAGDPDAPAGQDRRWRTRSVSPLLLIWWILYVVGFVLWYSTESGRFERGLSAIELANYSVFVLVVDTAVAIVAILAIVVVYQLGARQAQANAQFDVRSGA